MAVTELWLSALFPQNQVLPLEHRKHTTKNDSKRFKAAMAQVRYLYLWQKHPTPRQIIWLLPRLCLHGRRKELSHSTPDLFPCAAETAVFNTYTKKKILKSFFLFLRDNIIFYTILSQGNRRDRSPRDCESHCQVWVPACLIQTPRYIISSRLSPVPLITTNPHELKTQQASC